ncbi:MAG: arginine--tRNA ligase [Minisyncoccia bacterium]
MIRGKLEEAIRNALERLGVPGASFAIDYPPSAMGADYATNAALAAGKLLGKPPREVAEALRAVLMDAHSPHIETIEIAGPGFINFFLNKNYFAEIISTAREEKWGRGDALAGKKILVEYTDPNPFKEFHIGHLMSNAIGESISRLLQGAGASVKRANYQGDVGIHVAKALWALMLKGWDPKNIASLGQAYVMGSTAYEDDPAAKAEIDAINKKIYEKDPQLFPMYLEGRRASLDHFEMLYAILGTKFDLYFFESEVGERGKALVAEGLKKGVFEESDGAVIFRGERHGLHTRVFMNSAGLPTYEAKELGLVEAKKEKDSFDLSLVVTAREISDYFKVVRAAAEELSPELAGKIAARFHGFMRLTTGKMSSRKGNVITGEALIEDMIAAAKEKMADRGVDDVQKEKVARAVAVAAIKYSILRQASEKDIVFDPEKSLSLEGDSGPYLQYAHTRAVSILRNASAQGVAPVDLRPQGVALTQGSQGDTLLRLISRFPEIVARAANEYEPHHVAQYLTELASNFNSFYAKEKVLDGTDAAPMKLALVDAVRQTLRNGLWLLGIEAPEEM